MVKVSVITATFNTENTIPKNTQSVMDKRLLRALDY